MKVLHFFTFLVCWSPNTNTQEHGVLAMMKAPLIPGTRPVGAAQLTVKDTSFFPYKYNVNVTDARNVNLWA